MERNLACTGSPLASASPRAGPIERVTHAGRYTTFLRSSSAAAAGGARSLSGAAPCGMYGFQSGIMLLPTPHTALAMVCIGQVPMMEWASETTLSMGGTRPITGPNRPATHAAAAAPRGGGAPSS
eukprot:scaffold2574_cov110-Isochrysis_galbana.AAC.5